MKPDARPYVLSRGGRIDPLDQELDRDPRGVIWLYEPPRRSATYFMGVDAAQGIVGWNRALRTQNDSKTDNGVIEILRRGREGEPDAQAAEYAAPVDPETLADIANALGRIYAGNSEDEQCQAIIEVYPGPGGITQSRMIHVHGYTNLWIPRYVNALLSQAPRNTVGWTANTRSRRDLWIRSAKHILQKKAAIRSAALVEEMADCSPDDWMYAETARAKHGSHDDRVVAFLLAIYAAHDWSWEVETERVDVRTEPEADWQASDISAEAMFDSWEDRFSKLLE